MTFRRRTIGALFVVILSPVSNAIEDLLPLIPRALAAMGEAKPGQAIRISIR